MTTFDDILEEAGKFGWFQKRIFSLMCLVSVPFAGVYVGIVFLGFSPEHWCRNPAVKQVQMQCDWNLEKVLNFTVPFQNTSAGPVRSQCERFVVEWNVTELSCDDLDGEITLAELAVMPTTVCKDAWDYDYEGRESFVTEFNMVCEDAWLLDMCQAALSVGFLVGSIAIGYLADRWDCFVSDATRYLIRFGRKTTFLMSCVLNTVTGILVAVSPNYISLLVFRALYGFGTKGGWMVAFVLITELVGVEYRRPVAVYFQMFFSIGILILPLVAYLISDWRWLQVAITAPYLCFLAYYWFIPESPRWLLSQNNTKKAVEITKKMAKVNKKTLSKNIETLKDDCTDTAVASFMDLIRTPKMRKHTFILSYNWFTSAVVYQGLIMRLGILGGNVYVDFLISGIVEFPAAILILFTIDRIGRRLPFATANIVAGAACLITAFIPESLFWLKTAVACVGRLGITMAFEMVVFVNTELYPTFIRNPGTDCWWFSAAAS
ncbi:solute carrier family 22 member 2 isoform X3 [Hemibagrus wyckioides]|uniref:solute carrier family 22 member 2 isoform X3 n=1 Tax=Hemibagrus wyckioides TaxID=337641 RepID=UPI00266C1FC1|nr:solute carrier family 22 member 2 isoform X3 [Hemibagrus wyckioides]